MYYVVFNCNWAGLEIHEEQLDTAIRETIRKTKKPASGQWNVRESSNFLYS